MLLGKHTMRSVCENEVVEDETTIPSSPTESVNVKKLLSINELLEAEEDDAPEAPP